MKEEDFEIHFRYRGYTRINTYHHLENKEKRTQLMKDVMSGKVSKEEFYKIQKKMRGRSGFLKLFYTENEYQKAIQM